tara:strand:- start:140 stop:376 length:237 start_codon:yes stop_codon:yes gene_type:complete
MNDDFETLVMNTFKDVSKLSSSNIGKNKILLDIRSVSKNEDRRRILDVVTGLCIGRKCQIRTFNANGEFLIIPNKLII